MVQPQSETTGEWFVVHCKVLHDLHVLKKLGEFKHLRKGEIGNCLFSAN